MPARVTDRAFEPWQEISRYLADRPELRGKVGATVVFVGSMRDFNAGTAVEAMTLEHYPAMTAPYLQKLSDEAQSRWPLLDSYIVHRCGKLLPDDPIVLVAVWSAHRHDALEACRYLIDELKTRAPFWKQEQTPGGQRWVTQEKK